MRHWFLIDDSGEEAITFSRELSLGDELRIEPMSAGEAEKNLSGKTLAADGILMDVDLSNETGIRTSGPGMAANIRVGQTRQDLPSFPIVRFSFREKVLLNIGRDSSSDDLFDLKLDKDGISDVSRRANAQRKLIGASEVYEASRASVVDPAKLLELDAEQLAAWAHPAFVSEIERADRPHLIAAPIMRALVHPGLLIDESLLAARLGIDRALSTGWGALLEALSPFAYRGVGSEHFPLWWARGVESWWEETAKADNPLAAISISERTLLLGKQFADIVPLTMPKGSLGDRPWRYCLLTMEMRGEFLPVDPERSVRIIPRSPMPVWLDPLYAALGPSLRNREDVRLNKDDLKRLEHQARRLR